MFNHHPWITVNGDSAMKNMEQPPNNNEPQNDSGHASVIAPLITFETDTDGKNGHQAQISGPGGARKKKGPDELLETERKVRDELAAFIRSIPRIIGQQLERDYNLALVIVLGFLQVVLEENLFRYLLGLIVVHTSLTATAVTKMTHVSFDVIRDGKREVASGVLPDIHRQRSKGAGRKKVEDEHPWIVKEIVKYVELRSYGPCTKNIAEYTAATLDSAQSFLKRHFSFEISRGTLRRILITNNIILRTNKKLLYGNQEKETVVQRVVRHAEFEYIDSLFADIDNPSRVFLSIDCKQKINLGVTFASGKSYAKAGHEVKVPDHNFFIPLNVATLKDMDDLLERAEGKAIPYGIYDICMNKGYVNIGISSDTPEFVVESLRQYFPEIKKDHPQATELYLFCDGGGSNSARSLVLKYYLTLFSREIGMKICLVHYPPYRSKFNKIERKMFAPISKQFERCHLTNLLTVRTLIENTPSKTNLKLKARIDTGIYKTGRKLTDEEKALINATPVGNTKDLPVHLAFEIDGRTNLNDIDIPPAVTRMTVFDVKENIHQGIEEKAAIKAVKEAEKTAKTIAKAQREALKTAKADKNKTSRKGNSSQKKRASGHTNSQKK